MPTALETKYRETRELLERVVPLFRAQMGRELPGDEGKALEFTKKVYATEAASLVLARILFVRFFEDYDLVTRKISNGGVRAFREFHRHVKDDYKFLLLSAFRDAKALYARLFEESVFDWAHDCVSIKAPRHLIQNLPVAFDRPLEARIASAHR